MTGGGAQSQAMQGSGYSTLRVVLVVFLPFAAGFYISYLFRSVNAVIGPRLIADVGLSAGDLGLLTAAYFFGIAAFQPVLGMLLDRYGPRRVQASLFLISAVGAVIFAIGDGIVTLMAGRALIGVGMAGGLMTGFKAIVLWFDQRRWPLMNALYMTFGGLGAVSATTPVELFLQFGHWRDLFAALAVVTVMGAMIVAVVVPERATGARGDSVGEIVRGLGVIFTDRLFWRVAPMSATTMGFGMAFQGLWAGMWLKDVAGFSQAGVADHLLLHAASLIPGFLVVGAIGDWASRRGIPITTVCGIVTVPYLLLQIPLLTDVGGGGGAPMYLALVGIALLANANVLGHPLISRHFTERLSGRASTALNLMVFVGAFGTQFLVGALLDSWRPVAAGTYPIEAYRVTFGAMLALQLVTWLWFLVPHARKPM